MFTWDHTVLYFLSNKWRLPHSLLPSCRPSDSPYKEIWQWSVSFSGSSSIKHLTCCRFSQIRIRGRQNKKDFNREGLKETQAIKCKLLIYWSFFHSESFHPLPTHKHTSDYCDKASVPLWVYLLAAQVLTFFLFSVWRIRWRQTR